MYRWTARTRLPPFLHFNAFIWQHVDHESAWRAVGDDVGTVLTLGHYAGNRWGCRTRPLSPVRVERGSPRLVSASRPNTSNWCFLLHDRKKPLHVGPTFHAGHELASPEFHWQNARRAAGLDPNAFQPDTPLPAELWAAESRPSSRGKYLSAAARARRYGRSRSGLLVAQGRCTSQGRQQLAAQAIAE